MNDSLGDRMKAYEAAETGRRFMPLLPVCARIDGKNFSRFARSMERPFDALFSLAMGDTTRRLVEETGALAGYTQSDEISLLWYRSDPKSQLFFDGKIFKITSVTAALATAYFTAAIRKDFAQLVDDLPPTFDCRAFQLPNREEAANAFLWREWDATKNAISMAASTVYSHNELHGKHGGEMQEMLFQKGINFNDYPAWAKRGQFVLRRTTTMPLDPEILAKIPADKRPEGPVERQFIALVDMPPFSSVTNRVGVLFDGEEPMVEAAEKGDRG